MVLGFSEDFTSNVVLDSSLTNPTSGFYVNSGVSPNITIQNLLDFLPFDDVNISDWDNTISYKVYSDTRSKKDLVIDEDKLYESIKAGADKKPSENPLFWLETNYDSLKIKSFLKSVEDRVFSNLNLSDRLINNQYIYELGSIEYDLPSDYAAWFFEPKGSDYVCIDINEICFQAISTDPVNIYVINQGLLIDTLTITPNNGLLEFHTYNYRFKGKGAVGFVVDSTKVRKGYGSVDSFLYDGFKVSTRIGKGDTPNDAKYTYSNVGNGLGFNISVNLDSSQYILNNSNLLAPLIRATFEYVCYEMFLQNSNIRGNRAEMNMSKEELKFELKDTNFDTVVKRYRKEIDKMVKVISKTYDTQLSEKNIGLNIQTTSV